MVFLLACGSSAAQTYLATVRGTIHDRDGVIAGATVQLIEEETGLTRSTVTTATGDFVFASMRPGVYAIQATQPGF